jgi:type I restriction-modification system DNA methylase subunit
MNCSNIFDWLKHINQYKTPSSKFTDKDWDVFNSYMIHRFLSMDKDLIEVVNYVQEIPPQEKIMIYNIYKEFIPKNNKWNRYIKSKTKEPNKDLVEYIKNYFECSSKEAKEYINILDITKINRILNQIGLEKKEIKTLLK